jgi:carotenoid cleavage dioxygenase-like enzyme
MSSSDKMSDGKTSLADVAKQANKSTRVRGSPFMTGPWTPVGHEFTGASDLPVLFGRLPADIAGSFLRVGPNPSFPEKRDQRTYHFFAGDGMLHGVEIAAGAAIYRNRQVQVGDGAVYYALQSKYGVIPPDPACATG